MTSASRTLWEQGDEPGYEVAALAVALLLTAATIDLALADRLGLLFDLTFVTVCARAALIVRPAAFFTVGVLPPLAMLAAILLLALVEPASIAHPDDGAVQATVSGLSAHAVALVVGYLVCLAVLAVRNQVQTNRSGSPAPRRTSSG
ncbi:hypothetical protein D0Z08_10395 [Nocardioides immobilis]|uniref:DUF6542 domain-containing protein n=1 Tax=Nocardioides immobilis TaxID=2049295 RepID=A0A417Y335_9ACTN|nr:DUF6542 domain-containing protein [Nocardioides immobilis]RHW27072.1 hypothetical protein D0Z08_10395 [Nocardioides immobilis]